MAPRITDIGETFRLIARDLGEQIVSEVMPTIRREVEALRADHAPLCYSEEQAAAMLDMSVQTLVKLAKAKRIGFSYSIEPTQYDKASGRALNGRRVYLRHHILNYLLHREMKPETATKADLTAANVYQFTPADSKELKAA